MKDNENEDILVWFGGGAQNKSGKAVAKLETALPCARKIQKSLIDYCLFKFILLVLTIFYYNNGATLQQTTWPA